MGESYLVYSSLTLALMGCLALILSVVFRLKSRALISLRKDPIETVFNRTFNIFDPYPLQRKLIHRFLSVLPLVVMGTSFTLLLLLITVIASGLVLSALIAIFGLNLVVIEEAPDVYDNCKTFSNAIERNTAFANGDLKVLRLIKKLAPKLSKYYLVLSVLFLGCAIAVPYLGASVPWLFKQLLDSVMQFSGSNGILVMEVIGVVLALNLALLQFLAFWVKNRLFKYEV